MEVSLSRLSPEEKTAKSLYKKNTPTRKTKKFFNFPGAQFRLVKKLKAGANRELMEEMGYRANKLELLGRYLMNNRRSKMKMYVYLATGLVEESLDADPEEDIESFWFSEDDIAMMIKNGDIINVHSLASWCLYKNGNWVKS